MSNAIRALVFLLLSLHVFSCGKREQKVVNVGSHDPLHLIPFSCSYLGFPIPELEQCWLACNRSVIEDYELSNFTVELECVHPDYSALQCGLDI